MARTPPHCLSASLRSLLVAVALICGASCGETKDSGSAKSEEELTPGACAEELIRILGEVTETLESAKDASSAQTAAARFDQLTDETEKLMERMEELGPPTGDTKLIVATRVSSFQKEIDARMEAALRAARENPEVAEHIVPSWERMVKKSKAYREISRAYGLE